MMNDPTRHRARMERAHLALQGLSVGDAFGERFFSPPDAVERLIELRALPAAPWNFTDDTVMAMSVVDVLDEQGCVDRDRLADFFAARYRLDPSRGYGGTAHGILRRIGFGERWQDVSWSVFDGGGSMGNGGAMRAAPIGAWFAGDPERAAVEARASAEVTHAHPEGQAGAIAVAVAAAWVGNGGDRPAEMFAAVLAHTPDGETRDGLGKAAQLPLDYDVRTAVAALGNGSRLTAQDTVPFALWCAARHLGNYEEALWATVSGLGDRDTTCAIVGGIVVLGATARVPAAWLAAREPLERIAPSLLPERFNHRRGSGSTGHA
jgi:ADP-ribosylglycohydrolase